MRKIPLVERAFALARGGSCHNIADIRRALAAERYSNVDAHLAGSSIKKQLGELMARDAAGD